MPRTIWRCSPRTFACRPQKLLNPAAVPAPPRKPYLSIRTVARPVRDAPAAAAMPAGPPPSTTTSYSPCTVVARAGSLRTPIMIQAPVVSFIILACRAFLRQSSLTMTAPETQFDPDSARFGASRSQKRVEDERLLAGKGLYSDDRVFPGQASLVVLRSPHAHANIVSLDLAPVRAAPGVLAAWTLEDLKQDGVRHLPFPPIFKRADGAPMAAPLRTLLAEGKAFYVGQPVAAIVAATREQAQDAAELAIVEYEDLPCVTDAREAAKPGAPQIWPQAPGNVSAQARIGNAQAVDEAFARATHVTRLSLHNQRLIAMALEPRCSIAVHENNRFTLYTQNQTPTGARDGLAAALGGKPTDYRLIIGDIGGGFGMKTGVANEDALVCYAARKLGRPVKWRAERGEDFLAAHMGRDQHYDGELALDREGRILALRVTTYANFGAAPVGSTAIIPLLLAPKVQTTVYHVPAVGHSGSVLLTDTVATGAFRGAGG